MKGKWILPCVVLAGFLAPLASDKPDPVQKILRLPGGASTWFKTLEGMLVTFLAVTLLIGLMKKRR